MIKINQKFKGFSLVELIVVISIIAILSTVGILSLSSVQNAGDMNNVENLIKTNLKTEKFKIVNKEFNQTEITYFKNYLSVNNMKEDKKINIEKDKMEILEAGKLIVRDKYNNIKYQKIFNDINNNNNNLDLSSEDFNYNYQFKNLNNDLVEYIYFIKLHKNNNIFIKPSNSPSNPSVKITSPYGELESEVSLTLTDGENDTEFTLN